MRVTSSPLSFSVLMMFVRHRLLLPMRRPPRESSIALNGVLCCGSLCSSSIPSFPSLPGSVLAVVDRASLSLSGFVFRHLPLPLSLSLSLSLCPFSVKADAVATDPVLSRDCFVWTVESHPLLWWMKLLSIHLSLILNSSYTTVLGVSVFIGFGPHGVEIFWCNLIEMAALVQQSPFTFST